MRREHANLVVVGATTSNDRARIDEFLGKAGVDYPVVVGLESSVKEAYEVKRHPSLRVVDAAGTVVGWSMEDLERLLAPG